MIRGSKELSLKNQPFHYRLRFALQGLRATTASERSFRTQLFLAVGAIVLLVAFRPEPVWWALFALSIGGVLSAELLNTALEILIDHLHPEQHPNVARAKDCAAGAVLLLSLASLGVFLAMLFSLRR